jgi:hypothetical protein
MGGLDSRMTGVDLIKPQAIQNALSLICVNNSLCIWRGQSCDTFKHPIDGLGDLPIFDII